MHMQRSFSSAFLMLALGVGAVTAQTPKNATLPPGYDSKAGAATSYILGGYANYHHQIVDGTKRGTAMALMGLEYRLDSGRYYSAYSGMSREWTRVTLDLSEGDVQKMTSTFASNRLRTPTRVFDGKMAWPRVSTGTMRTAKWGDVAVKFSTTWVYTGKNDLCMEYDFQGGTLTNKAAWSGRTLRPYFFDGVNSDTVFTGGGAYLGSSSCRDSGQTNGAYSYGFAGYYGDQWVPIGWEDKLAVYHYTYYTAKSAPVIQLLAWGGNAAGVDVGAQCNKLYVDLSRVLSMTQRTSSTAGYSSYTTNDGRYVLPYFAPWGGASLWTQGAYSDSVTKAFRLTRARRFVIPTAAQRPTPMRKRAAVQWTGNFPAVAGTNTFRYYYQTLPRLVYR